MTDIKYAVIDNHKIKKGTSYNFIYVTKDFRKFEEFIREKGLI